MILSTQLLKLINQLNQGIETQGLRLFQTTISGQPATVLCMIEMEGPDILVHPLGLLHPVPPAVCEAAPGLEDLISLDTFTNGSETIH